MAKDIEQPKLPKPTKTAFVNKLLSRPRGASLGNITVATAWQAHSIRAVLTGLRKKGVALERQPRRDGMTGYRIVRPRAAPPRAIGDAGPASARHCVSLAGNDARWPDHDRGARYNDERKR